MQVSISFVGFQGESTGTTYTASVSGVDVFAGENIGSTIIINSRGGTEREKCCKGTNYRFNGQFITFYSERSIRAKEISK